MQKILVAVDGSESSLRALRFVLDARRSALPDAVHLLNVQNSPIVISEYVTSSMIDAMRAGQMQESRKVLDKALELAAASGVPLTEHIEVGFPDQVIVEQADRLGCEQIVMGTRGMGTIKGLVMGSVAQKVVHLAHVPVTLVK